MILIQSARRVIRAEAAERGSCGVGTHSEVPVVVSGLLVRRFLGTGQQILAANAQVQGRSAGDVD